MLSKLRPAVAVALFPCLLLTECLEGDPNPALPEEAAVSTLDASFDSTPKESGSIDVSVPEAAPDARDPSLPIGAQPGTAAVFSAATARVEFPDVGLPTGSAERTFEAWVRVASPKSGGTLLHYGAGTDTFSVSLFENQIMISNGKTEIATGIGLDTAWHHIAVVCASGSCSTFIDGTAPQLAYNLTLNTDFNGTAILGGPTSSFVGAIDEVRIWNLARTLSQVAANRLVRVPAVPNLVTSFTFEGVTGAGEGIEVGNQAKIASRGISRGVGFAVGPGLSLP